MSRMQYHYGLKMRCYPSDQQKKLIKVNSDASRFVYNEMIAIGQELMQLRRVKFPIDTVPRSYQTTSVAPKRQANVQLFSISGR